MTTGRKAILRSAYAQLGGIGTAHVSAMLDVVIGREEAAARCEPEGPGADPTTSASNGTVQLSVAASLLDVRPAHLARPRHIAWSSRHDSRFKQPDRRRVKSERHRVEAFIAEALDRNRLSLALGTAIQFETALRQRDVIGEWEPLPEGESAGGIVLDKRRWANGLTWAHIDDRFELFKATTRTSAIAAHDLTLCPETTGLLQVVPAGKRVGPLIIDEEAGCPYANDGYAREWRTIADQAGIPKHVWNMDAQAGAITEADDAGADLDEIRSGNRGTWRGREPHTGPRRTHPKYGWGT